MLLILIIAPIRVKKKIKLKDGKLQLEEVKEEQPDESQEEQPSEAKEAQPAEPQEEQPVEAQEEQFESTVTAEETPTAEQG